MKLFNVSTIVCLLFSVQETMAYEIDTHARITQKAYELSVLKGEDLLADFGVSGIEHFGDRYFDMDGAVIIVRGSSPTFEDKIIGYAGTIATSIQGWLMRGVIREDDCSIPFFCDNPQDDETGAPRPFNHFFDPVNNEKLWLGEYTAPNWMLGTLNAFPLDGEKIQPLPGSLIMNNHFTLFDAREAQYRALTGHTKNGTKDIAPSGTDDTEAQIRDAYWAAMFRALGDVVCCNGGTSHA